MTPSPQFSTATDLDLSAPPIRSQWIARLCAAVSWLNQGGGIGLLVLAALFAGPVFAQKKLAEIPRWTVENIESVPTAPCPGSVDKAPARVLRVILDRQYPVLNRRTWLEVDGQRLGPARRSADLRSLSVPLPSLIQVGPDSPGSQGV